MRKYISIILAIVIALVISILVLFLNFNNKEMISELTSIHYADIKMTIEGNDENVVKKNQNEFLNIMKLHLKPSDAKTFENNFYNNYDGSMESEWNKIKSNSIKSYTVYDAINYSKFKRIFTRASEIIDEGKYMFVIVTANSSHGIQYSYIYPYKKENDHYYFDYTAFFKISLIKDEFKVTYQGKELKRLKYQNFQLIN